MKYRTRIYYTQADKALMWERWRQGESLHAIARLFDRNHSAIGGALRRSTTAERMSQTGPDRDGWSFRLILTDCLRA